MEVVSPVDKVNPAPEGPLLLMADTNAMVDVSVPAKPVRDGLIYGYPGDKLPINGSKVREMMKVTSILEAADITCCMAGTSALIYFGARRTRGDWQICVPTDQLETAFLLLSSARFVDVYCVSRPMLRRGYRGSLLNTYHRFKCKNLLLWFVLVPSEDCHFDCSLANIERSKVGLPYPRIEVYAQSLVDTANAVDLCDLVDGMNLSEEWGNQNLDLEGTSDVEWAKNRNQKIREAETQGQNMILAQRSEKAMNRKDLWEKAVRKKEHRLGWKHPKEVYATRFRTHKSRDPRLAENM